jgi:hypothetical protein
MHTRCERASALLKQKMETEEDTKELGIKGVYQLQVKYYLRVSAKLHTLA